MLLYSEIPEPLDATAIEDEVQRLAVHIWKQLQGEKPAVFDKNYWQGRLLDWAMRDPDFKVDLFRFVDVLPALKSKEQVAAHVREYLLIPGRKLPKSISTALKVASSGVASGVASSVIRNNVEELATRFIAGDNVHRALKQLRKLRKQGYATTVDLLGEACLSEQEADAYANLYQETITALAVDCKHWNDDALLDRNHHHSIPRANVSLKLSAMYSQLHSPDIARAVFSRSPEHLALAKERFRVGNLYLNQACTGAFVDRQPFGGFGMSGTGIKAGGPGYLQQFSNARVVTENTIRRGFTPDGSSEN